MPPGPTQDRGRGRLWTSVVAAGLLTSTLGACVRVPRLPVVMASVDAPRAPGKLPSLLRVLVWNVRKGSHAGFLPAFRSYLDSAPDLVLLQEACLDDATTAALDVAPVWRFAPSWTARGPIAARTIGCRGDGVPTGVLTASPVAPLRATPLRATVREPFRTPKLALLTEFAIAGRYDTLLVANVHGLLLRGTDTFGREMRRLSDALRAHRGPLLLAGDFNTWSRQRLAILDTVTSDLRLGAVDLDRVPRGGAQRPPLDHVYVRDLEVVEAMVVRATASNASDHDAIRVTLRVTP